jgi:cytochrome P450 family 135
MRRTRPDEIAGLPPGPELSAEKQTARLAMRPLDFLEEQREGFGDVFSVRMLHEPPWVLVSDPDLIKQVFQAPADILHAGEGKRFLRPLLGDNSLLLLDEDAHMEQRKLLLPPFAAGHIQRYEKAMREAAERAIEEWPLGTEAPATGWTRTIAMEVILRTVFGLGTSERLDPLREALGRLRLSGNPGRSEAPGLRETIEWVDELIYAQVDRAAREGDGDGGDVLSLLLQARHEDGTPMTRLEIRDELMTLLWAGYETTATTLAWALEQLARDSRALERAGEEAEAGGGAYTDAAIKETLRLRPAVPIVAREVKAPFALGEHLIPPGVVIGPAVLLLHHRPDIYPDPGQFRPERFLERQPDPFAWIPFGGGVRRCIGARFALHEMRVILAALLARVTVQPADGGPEAMRTRNVLLTPGREARLRLGERS